MVCGRSFTNLWMIARRRRPHVAGSLNPGIISTPETRQSSKGRPISVVSGAVPQQRESSGTARLHRLGDFPLQVDDQQAVLEAGALDLGMVGQCELALEVARRDAAMQEGPLFLVALTTLERQHFLLDRQRDLLRREAGERDRTGACRESRSHPGRGGCYREERASRKCALEKGERALGCG